jgi:hypothetical protein
MMDLDRDVPPPKGFKFCAHPSCGVLVSKTRAPGVKCRAHRGADQPSLPPTKPRRFVSSPFVASMMERSR